ncbi:ubiquitin carboxyl-terminal hydrolase 24 [Caerostris extrusa]|uniref:Ubiquitin carboxyl-terminal hydrolase 24 n=1 Tax=Caerostris extrusa TaxID=172846 RepID=A0AAV4XRQ5_CAEEX|nr:ubiquitin carboxyl-terminal hydrolase 24 [Caerostris extrusa]
MRPDIFSKFASVPCVNDFIIDVLLCSSSPVVRQCALEEFSKLSSTMVNSSLTPKDYLIGVLLKARLPLWVPSSCIRGDSQRLLGQCTEYFELCCRLLHGLTDFDQKRLNIDPKQMIEEEISWLQGFSPSTSATLQVADSALMAGHFRYVKTLLTCDGVQKEEVGKIQIVTVLLKIVLQNAVVLNHGSCI